MLVSVPTLFSAFIVYWDVVNRSAKYKLKVLFMEGLVETLHFVIWKHSQGTDYNEFPGAQLHL